MAGIDRAGTDMAPVNPMTQEGKKNEGVAWFLRCAHDGADGGGPAAAAGR